jgi:malonyl-CoA O-methyltransferase
MPQSVDKALVRERFGRQLKHYDRHATVQVQMAERLLDSLTGLAGVRFARVLEIGCGAGTLTRRIGRSLDMESFIANDLMEACGTAVQGAFAGRTTPATTFLPGDFETALDIPPALDLILSNATFQWFTDLETMLSRFARHLVPGGVLAFSTFGPENLREIRSITRIGLSYPAPTAIEQWLLRDYRILHRSEDTIALSFDAPRDVLLHLRRTGVNAVTRTRWQRSFMREFAAAYRERWSAGNAVSLTYHPLMFIAEKT